MTHTFNKTKGNNEVKTILKMVGSLREKLVVEGELDYVSSDEISDMETEFSLFKLDIFNHSEVSDKSYGRLDEILGVLFEYSSGNFQQQVPMEELNINGGSHLDRIGMATNLMGAEIAKTMKQLKSYQYLIEMEKRCIFTIGDNGDVVNCSDALKKRFKLTETTLEYEPIDNFIENINRKEDKLYLNNQISLAELVNYNTGKKVLLHLRNGEGKLLSIESNIYADNSNGITYILELGEISEQLERTKNQPIKRDENIKKFDLAVEPPFVAVRNMLGVAIDRYRDSPEVTERLQLITTCSFAFERYSESITCKLIESDRINRDTLIDFKELFFQIHYYQDRCYELSRYELRHDVMNKKNFFSDPDLVSSLFYILFSNLSQYRHYRDRAFIANVSVNDYKSNSGNGVKIVIQTNETEPKLEVENEAYTKFFPDQLTLIEKIVEALKGTINISTLNKIGSTIEITLNSLR